MAVVIKGLLGLLAVSGLIYLAIFLVGDQVRSPCSPSGFPGRCYHTTQPICEDIWSNAEKVCREWIKQFTFPPGRLTSPIIEKCRQAELDKVLRNSLKSTPECQDYRSELDVWKQQNM